MCIECWIDYSASEESPLPYNIDVITHVLGLCSEKLSCLNKPPNKWVVVNKDTSQIRVHY